MSDKLKEYRGKRNFEKTAEPVGESKTKTASPSPKTKAAAASRKANSRKRKFAVQYHEARRVHYDFRLEWDGALLSWAVPKGPSYNTLDKRLAVKVEDHPLEYADFEGVIPKGEYGGGTVMLWDEGYYLPVKNFGEGLDDGSLKFELFGKRLHGRWALVKMENEKDGDNWLLIKEKDDFAQPFDDISSFVTSVKSGRTPKQIADEDSAAKKVNPFSKAEVQLAQLTTSIPDGDDWVYEVKYDGYRMLAFAEDGKVRLVTRNGNDYTLKFKAAADAVAKLSKERSFVLDGEMAVTDDSGRTNFGELQKYVKNPDGKTLVYAVFDLLAIDGKDIRELPLFERKEKLSALLCNAPDVLKYSNHVVGKGNECFQAAARSELEGIVGKKINSPYSGARNGDWIKLKCYNRQEFVIGGYVLSEKKVGEPSALLLGAYENGKLIYVGRAGTGITEREGKELLKKFAKLHSLESSFFSEPPKRKDEQLFFVKPELIAEVQFAEFTKENVLRQASFKGLRFDKDPKEVVTEKAVKSADVKKDINDDGKLTVCGVKITNPQKVIYSQTPEIKKADVIDYYARVAKRMLPYVGKRIVSVVRCHKGISSECFFKKHPASMVNGVSVITVENSEGKKDEYFYIENEKGLISEAQLGSLEFHLWGSRADNLEKPDMMLFDLDPDEGMPIEQVRQGVRDLKSVLDNLSLTSFLKTSGGKGYHIALPFRPEVGWDVFRDFAKRIAEFMEAEWPDRYTGNIRKIKRKGKIFIDWERNGRGATGVSPYSLRARPGAKVSMPISWAELDTVKPDGVDLFGALKRLSEPDPWKNFFDTDQHLKK